MAEARAAWGIDIGQAGLKAIRLKYAEAAGQVLAVAFDYVPHPKILSQPDAIPDELINQALERFLSRNEVKGDSVAISVPGQTALTRFIQLPPVESAKVAEIVKYEARQQIPFALEDVCWQWQRLGGGVEESGYMLEAEVGLFAMKRDQVMQHLKPFAAHGVEVDLVQIAPLALYNFLAYDRMGVRPGSESPANDEHTILLDMGADNTTLMVSNGQKIWIRNVPIGGNHFTRALTKEMKLTFAKAEHLKINATKAPDPRAVFQALRPVFNDYVSEIQRSIGYFSSVNRNAKIGKVIGLGNGFKLAGLQKFLQQNLSYDVERIDSFQALVGDGVLGAKLFEENLLSFAVPYGLALQGLGLTRVHVDLLPEEIRTERLIRQKKPWALTAAAAMLVTLSISAMGYARMANSVSDDFGKKRFGVSWKEAVEKAKNVASTAAQHDTAYKSEISKFEEQTKIDDQLVRTDQGRVEWIEMEKAWVECLPRDDPNKFTKPEDLPKRNRIKVYRTSILKMDDLSTWFNALKKARPHYEDYMRPEDKANPPEGPGFIVTLYTVHYHHETDADGNMISERCGANYVDNTFIKNLKQWYVSNTYPRPTGPVPVRGIGITHPVIVKDELPKDMLFVINRRKRPEAPASGRFPQRPGYPSINSAIPMDLASGRPGTEGGQGQQGPVVKRDEKKDPNLLEAKVTYCVVQFVWRPIPQDKRYVFNALYDFFHTSSKSDWKDFQKAKTYVDNALKKIEKAKGLELTQALYDEFVKHHYAEAAPQQDNAGASQ